LESLSKKNPVSFVKKGSSKFHQEVQFFSAKTPTSYLDLPQPTEVQTEESIPIL